MRTGSRRCGPAFCFPFRAALALLRRVKDALFAIDWFGMHVVVTAWKLVGWTGAFMFSSRWFVQFFASRRAGRPTLPRAFWYMSLVGSALVLIYFIWGKNDSVGIILNFFPVFIAGYNLWLDFRHVRRHGMATPASAGS